MDNMTEMCNVMRIHLKTGGAEGAVDREKLMDFCLFSSEKQYVVVGWSCAYINSEKVISTFDDYYKAVQDGIREQPTIFGKRMNAAINRFAETKENDLFWTRDLEGNHWICRAKGKAEAYFDESLDIGAVVPVEAYKYGLEVPGQISASFSRRRVAEYLGDNDLIVAFSKQAFNKMSGRKQYKISKIGNGDMLDNLPPFELEELVISYIQIVKDYYVLSNSIANNSTTIKIECEFRSRDKNNPERAVVQVKGGRTMIIDAEDYKTYDEDGYIVFFFAPHVLNIDKLRNAICITREELIDFYQEYKAVMPDSITRWEELITE